MKAKKLLSLVLAASMAFSALALTGCKKSPKASGQIVVGSITDIESNMMDGWTNGAANANIRNLIYGYAPITYTKEGKFIKDPQVTKDMKEVTNSDGSKTVTVTIHNDLKWNNGEKITAKDYVFSILLHTSQEYYALEAQDVATYANCFVGYEEYNTPPKEGEAAPKEKPYFKGVKLIDDTSFSYTIKAEELPFHFDIAYGAIAPYPMSVIAPDCEIISDDNGSKMSDKFTKELLEKTINDPATGYRYTTKVTCGPYKLESFDKSSKIATLVVNPEFKGTYDNVKPSIAKIILKKVNDDTQMDELAAGTVDLISGTSGGNAINAGLDVVESGKAVAATYLRAGFGQVVFACDFGPTQFPAVRQAITYCLDRDEFAKQYSGGFAKVVDSNYGLSTQEYKDNAEELKSKLNHYAFSTDKAKEILNADGWNLDKDGKPYVSGLRYKKVDGALMPCQINWANTAGNPVSDLLSTMLPKTMEEAGMKLSPTTVEWGVLLDNINRTGIDKPQYNMFNLATGFVPVPSYWYDYDPKYNGSYNQNWIDDKELLDIVTEMKKIPSDDSETWNKKWVEMQVRWNELMPAIPLYSDEYHDFYTPKLKGYEPDGLWQWDVAIVYATLDK